MVSGWSRFFRTHREVLVQPVIHLRRANGQGWDGYLHAHSRALRTPGAAAGVAVLFNPTKRDVTETVAIPLYYTGITALTVSVSINEASPVELQVERDYYLLIDVYIAAQNMTTLVFKPLV